MLPPRGGRALRGRTAFHLMSAALRTLSTERLTLEPLIPSHAEEMFAGLGDSQLYAHLDSAPPTSVEALRERYERLALRTSPDGREQWWNWVLREKTTGEYVGFVQATVEGRKAQIAYVLFRHRWGEGLAREAVRRMIAELTTHGVNSMTACVDRANERSQRLLNSLSFTPRNDPERSLNASSDEVWSLLAVHNDIEPEG